MNELCCSTLALFASLFLVYLFFIFVFFAPMDELCCLHIMTAHDCTWELCCRPAKEKQAVQPPHYSPGTVNTFNKHHSVIAIIIPDARPSGRPALQTVYRDVQDAQPRQVLSGSGPGGVQHVRVCLSWTVLQEMRHKEAAHHQRHSASSGP